MTIGSLAWNMRTQHGRAAEGRRRRSWAATPTGNEPRTYRVDFPTAGGPRNCLVEVCLVHATIRAMMWVHFIHRHVRDIVVIL